MLRKLLATTSALLLLAGTASAIVVDGTVDAGYGAPLASDAVMPAAGEGGAGPNAVMDLADLYVTNDATNLYIAVTVAADIAATDWGKYAVYIKSPGITQSTPTGDAWGRAVSGDSNFQFHSWVDGGGGAGFNIWNDGLTQFDDGSAGTAFAFAGGGVPSVVELSIPLATLNVGVGQTIDINAWCTGGGATDNGQDGIPSTIANATDWGSVTDVTPMVSYQVQAAPSLRIVDGVGIDPGTFVTLSAAVTDLVASPDNGDGVLDVIQFDANTTETAHVAFNFQTDLSDEVLVEGNGFTIVKSPSTIAGNVAMSIVNADNSSITINDLTIIPEYDTAGGATNFGGGVGTGAAMRIWDNAVATTDTTVVINNLTITGSTVGGVAVDPNSAAPADITRFVMPGSPIFAGGIRVDATTGGTGNTIAINNSVVAHTGGRGIYTQHKDGATLTTANCQTSYNLGEGLRSFSLTGNWNVTNCVSFNNTSHGFGMAGAGGSVGAQVNISGGQFVNNGLYGLDIAATCTATVDGIESSGNANRGLRYSNGSIVAPSLTNSVIVNNGSYGIDVNEIDSALSWTGGIDNLILSGNGSISATPSNMSYGDTNAGAVTITVSNVTFHNPGGDQATAFIARNFDHRFGNDQTWNFVDCIFSGGTGDDDVAFVVRGATDRNIAINVETSAIVLNGSHALDAVEEDQGNPAGITLIAVQTSDPLYLSTTFGDADFLHVDSQCYAGAGSGLSNLAGGGTYVGGTTCTSTVLDWELID